MDEWNFLGLSDDVASPDRARAWVLPVPYEATTSYGKETGNGPAAIVEASTQVELYDHERGCEPAMDYGVYTMDPLDLADCEPAAAVEMVAKAVADVLAGDPRPDVLAVLGGEHSISGGVAHGVAMGLPDDDFVAVHIDAHADLRDEYEGTPFSHACAARRILEVYPVFQIGIRNISEEGDAFRKVSDTVRTVFAKEATAPDPAFLDDLTAFVRGKKVYLTIDLDGLDPSIMPAVGTPEPGGLSWQRMLEIAHVICEESAAVPVFDVVELAPIPERHASDFLVAKLIYTLLSYILCGPT